jgi:hypothetical protein
MRILRLSLLRNYLILSKNIKKSLLIINIGIFLSIFAATSAMISIYIENKISNEEFELIEYQQEKRTTDRFLGQLPSWVMLFDIASLNIQQTEEMYEFIKLTDFGDKIISKWDAYLPSLYDIDKNWEEISDFKDFNEFIQLYLEILPESTQKEYKNLIKESEKYKKPQVSAEEGNEYRKKLFNTGYENLLEEIENSKNNIFYEGKVFDDYIYVQKFLVFAKEYFLMLEDIFRASSATSGFAIEEINKNIIKLSKYEKNIILGTFIFQFIIFLIIQYFEISSVTIQNIKNKVKK